MTIKNRGGRPKKPKELHLIKHSYSLSQTEAKALRDRVKALQLKQTEYIRMLIAKDCGLWSADHDKK